MRRRLLIGAASIVAATGAILATTATPAAAASPCKILDLGVLVLPGGQNANLCV